jgi:hypothetical protein
MVYDSTRTAPRDGSYYFSGNHDQMPDHQLVMFEYLSDG